LSNFRKILALFSLLLVIVGCDGDRNVAVFTGDPTVRLASIEITPDYNGIVQGATLQYAATATYTTGAVEVVTNEVTWTSSTTAATISATGLATGVSPGETVITASLLGISDTADLSVSELANAFALDNTGTDLLTFATDAPGAVNRADIEGLAAGDSLVGLDFRPQNNYLYGLGFNAATGDLTLYNIAIQRAPAPNDTRVFATPVGVANDESFPGGTTFGFDFNPTVDRIRVIASNGQNRRMNPNTGALVAPADGALNGGTASADGAAYTNNNPNATQTTLFTLDSATDSLFVQNPPNDGTQTSGVVLTDNGARVDFASTNGFDIPFGNDVATNNSIPTAGDGLAALNTAGTSKLYSIDLVDGHVHNLGTIGNGEPLRGLTLQSIQPGSPAVALNDAGTGLVRFNTATPGTLTNATDLLTFTPGEVLAGIDWRPATGQLFALGVNATADTATIYRVDPQTGGALTVIGTAGQVAFQSATNTPIDLPDPATVGYGFDFNPTVDRIRVVTGSGLDLRLNPVTGGAVDADAATPGTQPDGAINGGATGVSGAAYTNSFATAPTQGVTTLYTIDATTDSLFIQNPPNSGTQVLQSVIRLNGATLDFGAVNGFDIESTVTVATSNAAAAGRALAVLNVAGVNGLYAINLADGVATLLGNIAAGRGLAAGNPGATP
jgi:hypothetical protein